MQRRRSVPPVRRGIGPGSAPFDVPCPEGFLGVQYLDGTLVTVLAVRPAPPTPHRLAAPWSAGDGLPGIAGNTLRQWMTRPEGAATVITVMTEGHSGPRHGPAAAAYRTLTGPLSIAGSRRVHVVLAFAPLDHPELVAGYGSGTAAALRACRSITRRFAALLAADGVATTALTAAELTDFTTVQHARGPAFTVLPSAPTGLPEALESVWRAAGAGTTAVQCLVRADGPVVRARVRLPAAAAEPAVGASHGWQPLPADRPPLPGTAWPEAPLDRSVDTLADTVLPCDGAGPIVGADRHGRPVTLRLAGPDVPLAEISGDLTAAQRLVARLVAVGGGAAVFTDRPRRWAGLIDAVADPRLLHPASDGPATLLVDDRPDHRLGPLAGCTVLRLTEPGPVASADVPAWRADPDDPDRATVTGGGRSLRIRPVSTPAEDAFVRASIPVNG